MQAKGAQKLDKGAVVRALFTLPLLCKDYDMQGKGGLKVRARSTCVSQYVCRCLCCVSH